MTSAKAHDETDAPTETAQIESVSAIIRVHLENERDRVYQEIKGYPTPIPACDAQFNYLLEERVRIPQEIKRLEALTHEGQVGRDYAQRIDEFIASSNYINAELEQRIRSYLLNQLPNKPR